MPVDNAPSLADLVELWLSEQPAFTEIVLERRSNDAIIWYANPDAQTAYQKMGMHGQIGLNITERYGPERRVGLIAGFIGSDKSIHYTAAPATEILYAADPEYFKKFEKLLKWYIKYYESPPPIPSLSDLLQDWLDRNKYYWIPPTDKAGLSVAFLHLVISAGILNHQGWLMCKICNRGLVSIWPSGVSTGPDDYINAADPEFFEKLEGRLNHTCQKRSYA